MRLAGRRNPQGIVISERISDLARCVSAQDLVTEDRVKKLGIRWSSRPVGGGCFPRQPGLPGFCYCPPDPAGYRARSSRTSRTSSSDCATPPPAVRDVRDPLFSEQRDRPRLCDEIQARGLSLTFEAETRLDRLDYELLDRLYAVGFRAASA